MDEALFIRLAGAVLAVVVTWNVPTTLPGVAIAGIVIGGGDRSLTGTVTVAGGSWPW